jgi:hypothetical protein
MAQTVKTINARSCILSSSIVPPSLASQEHGGEPIATCVDIPLQLPPHHSVNK